MARTAGTLPIDQAEIAQRQKFRVADEIIPGEADQPFDRFRRIEMFEVERALLGTDFLVSAFQHGEVQVLLVTDVIVQHALVRARRRGDAVDTCAGQAIGGEFLLCGLKNAQPHAFGIALPFQDSFCLGQSCCSID